MTGTRTNRKILFIPVVIILILLISYVVYSLAKPADPEPAAGPRLYTSNVTANPGGEVYVSVNVADNPGFAGIVLEMQYDKETLRPLEIMSGGLTGEGLFASNISEGSLKMTWFDVEEINTDGELFLVKFMALGSAAAGSESPITLSYDTGNISNVAYENVHFELIDSVVTIADGGGK